MYNLAGVDDEAEDDDEVLKAGKKRASWLGVNLFTAIFASIVIGLFADTLESMVALAVLMPIVASMGGNAGTQSLTVVVRQLALGDISQGDAVRIIKKEVFISHQSSKGPEISGWKTTKDQRVVPALVVFQKSSPVFRKPACYVFGVEPLLF